MSHYDLGALTLPAAPRSSSGPGSRVPHAPRQPAPPMPPRLPARPSKQAPAQAQGRAIAAKARENQLRKQAQSLAARASVDQRTAKSKQAEIERLRKCVIDCAKAYSRAKMARAAFAAKPIPPMPAARFAREVELRKLDAAMAAALAALNAARVALEKAVREATAVAESPAQQALPIVQRELEQAKRDTQTETRAAVEAGAPPAALPPSPTPTEQRTDTQVSEVARDAPVVAEQAFDAAEGAANAGDKAVADAGAPTVEAPAAGESSPPPAVIEDAAKKAQDAVNAAVGAKEGSVLPLLAAVGIGAFLFMRKKS